jgi:acid stress chaperone HdeB
MIPKFFVSTLVVSSLVFALALASPVQAQVIDASKITCEDYVFYRISNPNAIAYWLSGYYHGKQNNPLFDPQALQSNADKVRSYCEQQKNWKETLMEVADHILEIGK